MTADPQASTIAAGFVLGAIAGSFIALLYIRMPQNRPVLAGRSRCDSCERPLGPLELVPLVSYALLRGRCRGCGAPIAAGLFVVEIAAALIGAATAAVARQPSDWFWALFGWALLLQAMLDLRHFWLPRAVTALLALGGVVAVVFAEGDLAASAIGGIAGFGLLELVRRGYRRFRGRDGMGGGDPLLLGAIGIWTGWQALPFMLVGASLAGFALLLARVAGGERIDAATRVPLGTCFAIAGVVIWLAAAYFRVVNLAAL